MKFPDDLLWGSASADMQYEGGFAEGGRLPTTHDYITAGNINQSRILNGYTRFGYRKQGDQVRFQCSHHMFLASSMAVKLGHELMPGSMFGAMYMLSPSYPKTCKPEDVWAWEEYTRGHYFFSDVMIRGYYPESQKIYFKKHGIQISMADDDEQLLKDNTLDYIAFSCYRSATAEAGVQDYTKAMQGNPYLEKTPWGWAIDPMSLRLACNWAYDRYQKPVFIVENGLGFEDIPDENGYVQDDYRIDYVSTKS